jgi:hypothetical protein
MKKLSLLLMAIVITACSEAAKPPRDAAMEGAGARIIIASRDSIPGDSQYVSLGKVRAHCMKNLPEASPITAADVIADGNLQRSAYRTYGSQVDAIVDTNISYVRDYTQLLPLFNYEGHLECEGTAIHFLRKSQ